MAIVAYTGLPGAGKSYDAVLNVIIPAIEQSRVVYTNLPLTDEFYKKYPHADIRELDLDLLVREPARIDDIEGGSVIVLDEVWRIWKSGLKQTNAPQEHIAFLAEHRHRVDDLGRSMQIIVLVQDAANMASFVRALTEETFIHTKLTALGMSKRYRVDIYRGGVTGQRPSKDLFIRQSIYSYKKEIFTLYKSHTQAPGDVSNINEQKLDKRGTIFGGVLFKLGLPLAVVFIGIGLWYVFHFFHKHDLSSDQATVITSATVTNKKNVPVAPQLSEVWRLVGIIQQGSKYTVMIRSDDGTRILNAFPYCRRVDPSMFGYVCTINNELITEISGDSKIFDRTDSGNIPLPPAVASGATDSGGSLSFKNPVTGN